MLPSLISPLNVLAPTHWDHSMPYIGSPLPREKLKTMASNLANISHASDGRAADRTAMSGDDALPGIGDDYRLPRLTVLSILGRMQDTQNHMPCNTQRARYLDKLYGALAARSMNEPLDAKESKALAALMRSIRQGLPKASQDRPVMGWQRFGGGVQLMRDVCDAMRAFSKAAAMRIKLEEETARWEAKYSSLGFPGTSHVKQSAVHLGVSGGLPGLVSLGGGVRLGHTKVLTADDAINVLSMRERAGRIYGKATAGVADTVGVAGEAWVEYAKAPAMDLGLVEDAAARAALKGLNRTNGLQQLRNAWRKLIGHRAQASTYDQIMRRANAYRDKLPMLVSSWGMRLQPMARALPSALSQVPLRAVVNQWRSNLAGAASAGVVSASATASNQLTEVRAALLTPISTYLEHEDMDTPIDHRRIEAIIQRGERLLGDDPATSPLPRLVVAGNALRSCAAALKQLEAEVDHYEQVARYDSISPKDVRHVEASFLQSWKAATREEVLVHMLDAHAWLRLNPQDLKPGDEDNQLAMDFDRVARKIHEMDVGHDREKVRNSSSVADRFMQKIRTSSIHMRVGAGIDAIGAGVGIGVYQVHRQDPNPLRSGECIDIELNFSLMSQLSQLAGSILDAIKPTLPDASLVEDISGLLGHGLSQMTADISGGGRIVFRFYKPAYQGDVTFPDEAKGYRFQTARFYRELSFGIGPSFGIPVVPGLMADVAVSTGIARSNAMFEHFGDNSLSGPLNRYMRLKDSKDPAGSWAAFTLAQAKSLRKLMERLGDPASAVHHEARYWDSLRGVKEVHPIFSQMQGIRTAKVVDEAEAIAQLSAFFAELSGPFAQMMVESGLITQLDLPVSPKPGWATKAIEKPVRVTRL